MSNFSKFLEMTNGKPTTVDLSSAANSLLVSTLLVSPASDTRAMTMQQFSASPASSSDFISFRNSSASVLALIDYQANFRAGDGNASIPGLGFRNQVGLGMFNAGSDSLGLATNSTVRITILSSGFVGVNNTNPLEYLDVNGNIRISGNNALRFTDTTGTPNEINFIAPVTLSASYNFNLPTTPGSAGQVLTSQGGGSTAMTWTSASGTVTSVSVTSANGFAGTVATSTTTPAITISTTINSPILAGNGTAISAATTTGTGNTAVLSAAPAITGAWTLTDAGTIVNASDSTKQLAHSLSGMTTGKTLTLSSSQTTTQTLTIPNITGADTLATLGLAQTFTGANVFYDTSTIVNSSTTTKVLAFNLSGMTAAKTLTLSSSQSTTQTLTIPNITAGDTLATLGLAQTFSASGTAITITNGATIGTLTLTNALSIANGGTDNGSLAVTAGGVLYTDGTKFQNVGAGSSGQVLQSNGSSAPSWVAASTAAAATVTSQTTTYSVPSINYIVVCSSASFTVTLPTAVGVSGGYITILHNGTSITDKYTLNTTPTYTFTIPSSSITAGTVYTNNGHTFTVVSTTSSSTSLVCTGTGAPTASGTLTFVSGSPSGNLSFSASSTTNETIGGVDSGSYLLTTQEESLTVYSDGSNWQISEHLTTSAPQTYTPTFTGLGTPTNVTVYSWREGKFLCITGQWQNGTVSGSNAEFTLGYGGTNAPSGLAIDTNMYPTATSGALRSVCRFQSSNTAGSTGDVVIQSASSTGALFFCIQGQSTINAGTSLGTNSTEFLGVARVAISDWQP